MNNLNRYRNQVKVFNTEQFSHFLKQNESRNNGFPQDIISNLDPAGWHVMQVAIVHNDCELRCWTHVKEVDKDEPTTTLMDIDPKDFLQGHDVAHIAKLLGIQDEDDPNPPDDDSLDDHMAF